MSASTAEYVQLMVFDKSGVPLGEIYGMLNLTWSRALNKSGQLTFDLPVNHPKATAELIHMGNIFLVYSSSLLVWAGEFVLADWQNDTLTVTGATIDQRLGKRRATPLNFTNTSYGSIVQHLINEANNGHHTGIYLGDMFVGGPAIQLNIGADNIYQKLGEICAASGYDYNVLYTAPGLWELDFYEHFGSDLTASVILFMGYDTDGPPTYTEDWTNFANSILAVGNNTGNTGGHHRGAQDAWSNRPMERYTDQDSVSLYGFSEDVIDLQDVNDHATLLQRAHQAVKLRKYPQRTLSFTLNKRRSMWGQFQVGDTIAVHIPYYGFTGLVVPYRVSGVEVHSDLDQMLLVGDILSGDQAQLLNMFLQSHYGSGGNTLPATGG